MKATQDTTISVEDGKNKKKKKREKRKAARAGAARAPTGSAQAPSPFIDTVAELGLLEAADTDLLRRRNFGSPKALRRAVSKMVVRKIKSAYDGAWVCAKIDDDRKLWVKLGQPMDSMLITGKFEAASTMILVEALRPGGTFIDIGANIGWYTINAGTWYRKNGGGKIIAVEPIPEVFSHLMASIRDNGMDAFTSVHNLAVAETAGELAFHLSPNHLSGSHLLVGQQPASAGDRVVRVVPADDLIGNADRVDIIKIDIEGAEPMFLKGSTGFFARQRPPILTEVHGPKLRTVSQSTPAQYLQSIVDIGYKIYTILRDGRLLPATPLEFDTDAISNVLCLTPDNLTLYSGRVVAEGQLSSAELKTLRTSRA